MLYKYEFVANKIVFVDGTTIERDITSEGDN